MSSRVKWSKVFEYAAVAVLALVPLWPVRCKAQGFPPISPEDLKMTSEPKAPGAPAIILFREVDRDDQDVEKG